MGNRMQLLYDEIMDMLDIKYFRSERLVFTLPVGKYEITDSNKM